MKRARDIATSSEEAPQCTICLEAFENEDTPIRTPCFHLFHQSCMANWYKAKRQEFLRAERENSGFGYSKTGGFF